MMSLFVLLPLLAALSSRSVSANPLRTVDGDIIVVNRARIRSDPLQTSLLGDDTIALCERAPNCEVYEHAEHGKAIRFVPGMGPGSLYYNSTVLASPPDDDQQRTGDASRSRNTTSAPLTARDAGDYANLQGGVNVLNWGNVQPQVVMNHLYDVCQYSACDQGAQYYGTQAVRDATGVSQSGSMPTWYSVIFEATGSYNGWEDRNNFVEAIKTMSEKGQTWNNRHWEHGTYNPSPNGGTWSWDKGDLWEISQSDFFSINRWSSNGYFKGFMQVYIRADWGDKNSWGCERVYGFLKDAISAINPWGGAFFGLMQPVCN